MLLIVKAQMAAAQLASVLIVTVIKVASTFTSIGDIS